MELGIRDWGDWELGRLGIGEIGNWGDWELGRLGIGEIGNWGDWELGDCYRLPASSGSRLQVSGEDATVFAFGFLLAACSRIRFRLSAFAF
jgi:hypothetical protein